jgi:hypothetical protein
MGDSTQYIIGGRWHLLELILLGKHSFLPAFQARSCLLFEVRGAVSHIGVSQLSCFPQAAFKTHELISQLNFAESKEVDNRNKHRLLLVFLRNTTV